jgi:hypothetical protein
MSSSDREILEVFEPFIKMGVVGFNVDCQKEELCHLTFGKPAVMDKVFSNNEIMNLPNSKNMNEAYKNGCKTDEEMSAYTNVISNAALEKAIETGEYQICDTIGMFECKDDDEECNWDMIYEVVTPQGEFLYLRKHTF